MRLGYWAEGLQLLRDSPLFGIGQGNFGLAIGNVAHNSFVHCFTELGVIGGAIAWPFRAVAGLLVRRPGPVMATADSAPLAVPGDGGAQPAQSVAQYVSREPSDLIEEEMNGVTVVSRQAAE